MNIFPIVNSVKCTKGLEGCNRKQPGTNQQTWQTGKLANQANLNYWQKTLWRHSGKHLPDLCASILELVCFEILILIYNNVCAWIYRYTCYL